MSGYLQGRHAELYDPVSKALVGFLDGNGNEQLTVNYPALAYNKVLSTSLSAQPDTANGTTPTVTFGTVAANSTVVTGATITAPSILLNDARITTVGALKLLGQAGFYLPVNARLFISSAVQDKGCGFKFITDAQKVDFVVVPRGDGNASFRIYVDGQYINDATSGANNGDYPNTAGAGALYVAIDFGSSKASGREVMVIGNQNSKYLGINVTPLASVWVPPVKKPKMGYVSDSFGAERNWLNVNSGMFQRAAQALGMEAMPSAASGTGYINNGSSTNFITRVQDVSLMTGVDLFIIAGGCNDFAQTPSVLQAAVTTYITTVRAILPPSTPIIVLNAWFSHGQAITAAIAAAIVGGFTVANASNCYFIDNLAQNWVSGTGYSGAATGDGNADLYVGTDQTHPTLAANVGHDYLGARLAREILATLKAVAGL